MGGQRQGPRSEHPGPTEPHVFLQLVTLFHGQVIHAPHGAGNCLGGREEFGPVGIQDDAVRVSSSALLTLQSSTTALKVMRYAGLTRIH
ncbi:hypothetical protein GCM10008939_21080 [Deinococcus aquiradiocola]|uniref:Uncharacterized protein n=1 Tax=Deinococcus aquiradiocola TaxID=393059 RepID=A0A917UQE1_9DEIO|nr:hypothetical protein GCM10008939_21080 [Deinococcus aquiradiocola]